MNSMQSSVELYCIVDFFVPALVTANLSLSICPSALAKTTLLAPLLPALLEFNLIVPVDVIVPPEIPLPEVAIEVTVPVFLV